MTKVILQPCGAGLPAKHYADTVEMLVPLSRMAPFLSKSELAELTRRFPSGKAAVWGVTPGDSSVSETKWQRVNSGDVALFAKDGRIFSAGIVAMKIRNPKLSRELWGEDKDGDTWEFIYFLQDIRKLDISYEQFNAAAGYKKKNIIRGFNVLPEDKSAPILQILNMEPAKTFGEKELEEIQKAITRTDEFDPESEAEGRKRALSAICRRQGQPKFRKELIGAYSGRCAISGCDAPETLEAAHILAYNGPKTNHPANGLLLRADLHVLFDLGLITIDPSSFKVVLAPALRNTTYAELEGKIILLPSEPTLRPNRMALNRHRLDSGL